MKIVTVASMYNTVHTQKRIISILLGPENEAGTIHLEASYLARDVSISIRHDGVKCVLYFLRVFFSSRYLSGVRPGDETLTHAAVFTPARGNTRRCLNIWWSVGVKPSPFHVTPDQEEI